MNSARILILALFLQSCLGLDPKESGVPNLLPNSEEIQCERLPTAYVVGETIDGPKNDCNAVAKIQAIAYECGLPTETYQFTSEALKLNVEKARLKCDAFCKGLGQTCYGVLTEPSICGLISPPQLSLEFGKKVMHCPDRCKGQAFNYCSIYQGQFFSADPVLFKNVKENCTCRKRR